MLDAFILNGADWMDCLRTFATYADAVAWIKSADPSAYMLGRDGWAEWWIAPGADYTPNITIWDAGQDGVCADVSD